MTIYQAEQRAGDTNVDVVGQGIRSRLSWRGDEVGCAAPLGKTKRFRSITSRGYQYHIDILIIIYIS